MWLLGSWKYLVTAYLLSFGKLLGTFKIQNPYKIVGSGHLDITKKGKDSKLFRILPTKSLFLQNNFFLQFIKTVGLTNKLFPCNCKASLCFVPSMFCLLW